MRNSGLCRFRAAPEGNSLDMRKKDAYFLNDDSFSGCLQLGKQTLNYFKFSNDEGDHNIINMCSGTPVAASAVG
jgi:hypothetical protein